MNEEIVTGAEVPRGSEERGRGSGQPLGDGEGRFQEEERAGNL